MGVCAFFPTPAPSYIHVDILLPSCIKPLIPIQTQLLFAPFPFQSTLTVIEFTITPSQWADFASQAVSLAVCVYTVPLSVMSWVSDETAITQTHPPPPPPCALLALQHPVTFGALAGLCWIIGAPQCQRPHRASWRGE